MRWIVWCETKLVRLYQVTLSPFLGAHCRYHPTCSRYALMALEKHGFFKGNWMTVSRLVRCAPWGAGGEDYP